MPLQVEPPLVGGRLVAHDSGEVLSDADQPIDLIGQREDVTFIDPVMVHDGRFSIRELEPGSYRVDISRGYPDHRIVEGAELQVTEQPQEHELRLAERARFPVQVQAVHAGQPVAGAVNDLLQGDRVVASGRGSLAVEDVRSGEYTVRVRAPGYLARSEALSVEAPVRRDLALQPPAQLRVQVEGADPAPAETTVEVLQTGAGAEPTLFTARAGDGGAFVVEGLAAGPALLVVDVPGRARQLRSLTIAGDREVVVEATAGVRVAGHVALSKLPEGAQLVLIDAAVGYPAAVGAIAEDGAVELRLMPGSYRAYLSDGRQAYPLGELAVDERPAPFLLQMDAMALEGAQPISELLVWPHAAAGGR